MSRLRPSAFFSWGIQISKFLDMKKSWCIIAAFQNEISVLDPVAMFLGSSLAMVF